MTLHIIVGSQWGDEGKGRITDWLASQVDIVARYSGGDNAGHTVTIGSEIFKLHLLPSGIVHQGVACLLGNGVVINPATLLREIAGVRAKGVDVTPDHLKVSRNAHLITPAHIALDKASEAALDKGKIGTTQRGIGPTYTDKAARCGLRTSLLANPDQCAEAIHTHIVAKNSVLERIYGMDPLSADSIASDYYSYAKQLAPFLVNSADYLHKALAAGKTILAEGAQGSLLDLDHGTYPFVTSSSPLATGALLGLGVGPKQVGRIIGVAKVFSSRVGSGPFVSEVDGEMALRLRGSGANPWDEYGTTTGRPRRVGWLDLVALRYASQLNSFTELILTKLDVLSDLPELKVCVGYQRGDEILDYFPNEIAVLEACRPIYRTFEGWQEPISGLRHWDELPANAQAYIQFIEETIQVPVSLISVGPERDQTIHKEASATR